MCILYIQTGIFNMLYNGDFNNYYMSIYMHHGEGDRVDIQHYVLCLIWWHDFVKYYNGFIGKELM